MTSTGTIRVRKGHGHTGLGSIIFWRTSPVSKFGGLISRGRFRCSGRQKPPRRSEPFKTSPATYLSLSTSPISAIQKEHCQSRTSRQWSRKEKRAKRRRRPVLLTAKKI